MLLRTGMRSRGSPGPAPPDRWRQESRRIGPSAAPARPKPRAILKARNHSGLAALQCLMTTQAGRALFAGSPMATVRTRAVLIGEIGAASSPNPRWPNTQSAPPRSARSVGVRFNGARSGRTSGRRCATARSAAAAAVPALPIPMGWREPRLSLSRFRNTTAESAERPNPAFPFSPGVA